MNVLGTSNIDTMQAGERYEQSYTCVGNAAWKHIVENTHSTYNYSSDACPHAAAVTVAMVQPVTRLRKACVAHDKLADELETFATATRDRGLCEFWTCDRKSYILDLPTAKGVEVLGIIESQFQGRFEGFSGDSGAPCSSAGVPSSKATATHCYYALAALDTALQALATRAWASIVHPIQQQMGGHPSWEGPPQRLCEMHEWFEKNTRSVDNCEARALLDGSSARLRHPQQ